MYERDMHKVLWESNEGVPNPAKRLDVKEGSPEK